MENICRVEDCGNTRAEPSAVCSQHRYKRSLELRSQHERYKRNRDNNPNATANSAYWHMRARCENVKVDRYPRYGGRGIKVCDRWRESFKHFLKDMGRPRKGMTLERLDVNGDYEPGNCKWATKQEQVRNKGIYTNNKSGFSGVTKRYNGTWRAGISVDGYNIHIGYFKDKDDAASARLAAEYFIWGKE